MARKHHPGDLTDGQGRLIKRFVPKSARRGRKPIDRRGIINAILYVRRAGCPWRALAYDFPHWKTVYNVFRQWRINGVWQAIHDGLRELVRKSAGKKRTPTVAIMDSPSVKTTEVGGPERGYDARKKVSGRKRHIAVDTLGWILAVVVHAASCQDDDGARLVFRRLHEEFRRLKVIFADAAYRRNGLPDWVRATMGWILRTVLKPVGVKGFVIFPKRWIVERTFAWLGRWRRHSTDYERNPETSEAMIQISMIALMARRLAAAEK